ncbi:hypothetical protein [Streptomyces sp. NPDC058394]|uniref:hypothetical protein n=1 Tax=unclassified Streptomyces TaxID=2593676 RepID=UPI00364E014B
MLAQQGQEGIDQFQRGVGAGGEYEGVEVGGRVGRALAADHRLVVRVAHRPLRGDEDLRVEHLDGQLAGEGFGLLQVSEYGHHTAQVVLFDEVGRSDGLGPPDGESAQFGHLDPHQRLLIMGWVQRSL